MTHLHKNLDQAPAGGRGAAGVDLPPPFRAIGITAYLANGGTLDEYAQRIAGHPSPKTTKLYDRTADTISVDEIERIVRCAISTPVSNPRRLTCRQRPIQSARRRASAGDAPT